MKHRTYLGMSLHKMMDLGNSFVLLNEPQAVVNIYETDLCILNGTVAVPW